MPEPNRQERRREKYGGGRATDQGGWPTTQPNPIFGDEPEATAAAQPVRPAEGPGSDPGASTEDSANVVSVEDSPTGT